MEIRLARLEGAYEQIDKRLESLERQFNTRFGALEARFDTFEGHFGARMDALQWRMIALIVGTWTTTMLAVLGLYIKH